MVRHAGKAKWATRGTGSPSHENNPIAAIHPSKARQQYRKRSPVTNRILRIAFPTPEVNQHNEWNQAVASEKLMTASNLKALA